MKLRNKYKEWLIYWIVYLFVMVIYFGFSKMGDFRDSQKVKAIVIDRLYSREGFMGVRSGYKEYYYPQLKFTYKDSNYIFADRSVWARNKKIGEYGMAIFPYGKPEDAALYFFIPYWVSYRVVIISFLVALTIFWFPLLIRQYNKYGKR